MMTFVLVFFMLTSMALTLVSLFFYGGYLSEKAKRQALERNKSAVLVGQHAKLQAEHSELIQKWNRLTRLINEKGGMSFLSQPAVDRTYSPAEASKAKFTPEEVRFLIKCSHPDKHAGSAEANAVTVKLLAMKKG